MKMRTGLTLPEVLDRSCAIKARFASPASIAVDAFHSWNAAEARAFIAAVDAELLWVE